MSATNVMREEHGGIHLMLRIVDAALTEHQEGSEEAFKTFSSILEFFQVFADRCHHGKEEDLLFPALTGNEGAEKIIEGLLVDHERGRKYVREIESSLASWKRGDDGGRDRFRAALTMYSKLLSEHIRREDEELWPVADGILPVKEGTRLIVDFERVETEKIGEGKHEEFHELLHSLQKRYLLPEKTDLNELREYNPERFNPKTILDREKGKFIIAFFRAGQFIPVHSPSVDLALFVVEGAGEVVAGDKRYPVKEGSIVYVPAYVRRGVHAETDMTVIHAVTPSPTEADHAGVKEGLARGKWEE